MFHLAILRVFPKKNFRNLTVSLSHMLLEENYLKRLEAIRHGNKALEFCNTLIDAKKLVYGSQIVTGYSLNTPTATKNKLNTLLIIYKLKDMIHDEKPEYHLVDLILKVLEIDRWKGIQSYTETRTRLIFILLNFDNFKFSNTMCQNAKEHLKSFMNELEYSLKLRVDNNVLFHSISPCVRILKMLEFKLLSRVNYDADEFCTAMDKILLTKHKAFKDVNKDVITLVAEAVPPILTFLSHLNTASKFVQASWPSSDENHVYLKKKFCKHKNICYIFLEKISIYHMTLKEKLLKNLKDINTCYNAHKFCQILFNYAYSKTGFFNADLVVHQLKDIIHVEKNKSNLTYMITRALENKADYSKANQHVTRILSDLDSFDFLKPKCQDSERFLMDLIKNFESVFDLYGYKMSSKDEKGLDILSNRLQCYTSSNTSALLYKIFQLLVSQLHISKKEKVQYGILMVESISIISKFVMVQSYSKISSWELQKRSALQFVKDFFFPVVTETSFKTAKLYELNRCIQNLDETITKWSDLPLIINSELPKYNDKYCYSGNESESEEGFCTDYEEADTDLEEAGASQIPKSHIWWAKCSEILIKINNK